MAGRGLPDLSPSGEQTAHKWLQVSPAARCSGAAYRCWSDARSQQQLVATYCISMCTHHGERIAEQDKELGQDLFPHASLELDQAADAANTDRRLNE